MADQATFRINDDRAVTEIYANKIGRLERTGTAFASASAIAGLVP